MCTSETVVCFGIVMRSWQLIVAAKAFAKFSPQLRGIDIIISRQRNGTLRVTEKMQGMRNISDMPLEVLEMIRSMVFGEREMKNAAARLARTEMWNVVDWKKVPTPPCERNCIGICWDSHYRALHEVNFSYHPYEQENTALLAYYGLELASVEIANQAGYEIEDASTSVVALPASIEKITIEVDHEGIARANGMKLPSSSNRFDSAPNFRRFYCDFHFDVVSEISLPPIAPVVPAASPVVRASKESSVDIVGQSKSSVEQAGAVVKPDWIVWTSTYSCS